MFKDIFIPLFALTFLLCCCDGEFGTLTEENLQADLRGTYYSAFNLYKTVLFYSFSFLKEGRYRNASQKNMNNIILPFSDETFEGSLFAFLIYFN